MKYRATIVVLAVSVAFAGCSSPSLPTTTSNNITTQAKRGTSHGTIYVVNAAGTAPYVSIYSERDGSLLRTISLNGGGSGAGVSMAVSEGGTLYLADYGGKYEQPQLRAYGAQGSKLLRTTHPKNGHGLGWLTVDAYDDVYASSRSSTIFELVGPLQKKTKKYAKTYPPIAVDAADDVALAGCQKYGAAACVFHRGEKAPFWKIDSGVPYGTSATTVFDPSGNLYASNLGAASQQAPGSIAVFQPGATVPSRTITNGISAPVAMAAAGDGTLYVYNACAGAFGYRGLCTVPHGDVTVYPSGSSDPSIEITTGVSEAGTGASFGVGSGLALDSAGTLYVVNQPPFNGGNGTVTTYAAGSTSPALTITDQIDDPIAVAVGP